MAVSGSSSIRAAFVKKQSGSRASTAATLPSESRVPLQAEMWARPHDADREVVSRFSSVVAGLGSHGPTSGSVSHYSDRKLYARSELNHY